MRILPYVVSLCLILGVWTAAGLITPIMVPPPWEVLPVLADLLCRSATWQDIGLTLLRGAAGLGLAVIAALCLGVPAGMNRTVATLIAPLVAALQSCPPVLWISLVLVWAGTGSAVPVAVVFTSVFPPLFANVVQGCLAIDTRLLMVSRFYHVPRQRMVLQLIVPGLMPYLLASLSYVLAAAWKVAAVAEYLGSGSGIGARIYWSYRVLDIPSLFAWGLILVSLGVGLEMGLVARLRQRVGRYTSRTKEAS